MANDEREEEREFLAGLKARTGRALAEWMAAIAAQGFSDKNEIIDWLRSEGLPFARASWLERIHRNGGRPIHAGSLHSAPAASGAPLSPGAPAVDGRSDVRTRPALVLVPQPPQPLESKPLESKPLESKPAQTAPQPQPLQPAPAAGRPAEPAPGKSIPAAAPRKSAPVAVPTVEPPTDPARLEKLVAAAKGYRPLYHYLEAQIRQAIAGVVVAPRERYVAIGAPREFAAVTLHPTEIRLGLGLGDRPFDAQAQQAKMRGPGPGITHMVVLTDARQIDAELLALVKTANGRVNASA